MGANVKILNDDFNGGKTVNSITITNAGTGYTSVPTVAFSAPVGVTTATGTAVLHNDCRALYTSDASDDHSS